MLRGAAKEVLLTFDVEGPPRREDFIEPEILGVFYQLLMLLKKHSFRALFFLTGSIAEKLVRYPEIIELLKAHEIGYHSGSHSVKPRIFEYTDVKSYEEAIEVSIERESSSIDPLTGDIVGEGGIIALREIFPEKKIDSFRAPFLCWSPPHLEALRELGFNFDFSADVSNVPSFYKGITFMPSPTAIDSMCRNFDVISKTMMKEKFVVFMGHPSHTAFQSTDSSHQHNNPFVPIQIRRRSRTISQIRFLELELFFSGLCQLQRKGIITLKNLWEKSEKPLDLEKMVVTQVFETSLRAPKKIFGYKPKFLLSHFYHFFGT